MATDWKPTPQEEPWHELAEQLENETDPTRVLELAKRLIRVLDFVYAREYATLGFKAEDLLMHARFK